MSTITSKDVQNIAKLARLRIEEGQSGDYEKNLTSILDLVEQMNAVDTSGVEPMSHPLHMSQRLREDVVTEENQREHLQAHAPAVEDGHFLVPKVID